MPVDSKESLPIMDTLSILDSLKIFTVHCVEISIILIPIILSKKRKLTDAIDNGMPLVTFLGMGGNIRMSSVTTTKIGRR